MKVYILTIILVSFTSIISEYHRSENKFLGLSYFFFFLTSFQLISVAGLRWGVYGDYFTYARNYNLYKLGLWESIKNFNEPGIRFISYISSYIYDDYATMFFISSVITVGLFSWTIYKYSDNFFLSILLYILIGSWHGSFNGVRQFIASAILFAGHRYILEKKLGKYIIVVFIASCFHISALVMILLYLVPKKRLNFKQIIVMLIIIAISLLSYNIIFQLITNFFSDIRTYNFTFTEYVTSSVSIFRIFVMMAPVIMYVCITPKNKLNNDSDDSFYINMLFINAAIYLITSNSIYLARFAIFTTVYLALGLPKLYKSLPKKTKLVMNYLTFVAFSFYWAYEVINISSLFNYQWIFQR